MFALTTLAPFCTAEAGKDAAAVSRPGSPSKSSGPGEGSEGPPPATDPVLGAVSIWKRRRGKEALGVLEETTGDPEGMCVVVGILIVGYKPHIHE